MMKQSITKDLLTILVSMMGANAFAADIAVENADGVTIYYNYINDGKELEVTSNIDSYNKYKDYVIIPEEVTYMNRTRKVTSIGQEAFCYCSDLTSVTIPSSVTSIGDRAFQGCSSLSYLYLPSSLRSIGSSAFADCSNITSLSIANGLESIGYAAFQNCRGITWTKLPSSLKEIAQGAFWGCGLMWVTIPKNVCSIGSGPFQGCPLYDITVEEGNTTYDSRNNCCAIIETATNTLIAGCENTIIPNDVLNIGTLAFAEAYDLTSITIPESVTRIRFAAFGKTGLTSITVPSSVIYMEDDIFWGCQSLSSATIEARIKTMPYYFFSDCSSLKSVSLPSSLESIQQKAFANCQSLSEIYCYAEAAPIANSSDASNIFQGCTLSNITLYVPQKALTSYKNTEPWNNLGKIVGINEVKYKLSYFIDGNEYKSYEVEFGDKITPEPAPTKEGYTFSGWSEIPETMPNHDVTVTGTFTINKYKLIYMVDGTIYKFYNIKYGSTIIPEADPIKEGYTFSGWSEIPEEMPARDVTITGTFTRIPLGQCTVPTIKMEDGVIVFACETEDVEYHYTISHQDVKTGDGNNVKLTNKFIISVYASKDGYTDSEVAKAEIVYSGVSNGDMNGDGVVNVADIVKITNLIMNK